MRYLFLFLILTFPNLGLAQEAVHGLSMIGEPKYDRSSPHLSYANPDSPKGGTVKQAVIGSFDTLNAYNFKGKAAAGLHLTTDRLMQRVWDEPFTLYALIAEKVTIAEDRSHITFHLNPKARFHDNNPITAQDVAFSHDVLKRHGSPNTRRVYKLITDITIEDSQTIRFDLGEGYDRETVMILAMMPVLSASYWQEKDFTATTLEPPLGNGPYRIAEVNPGSSITYERVEEYWAANSLTRKGHFNFDHMTFDYFRDDTVAMEAFNSGDIDLRKDGNPLNIKNSYSENVIRTFSHQRPLPMTGFIINMRRSPLDDSKVREALITSFDFDWVNQTLMAGKARQVNSLFTGSPLSANAPLPGDGLSQRQRLRKSNQLLNDAGWDVQDGKRVNAQGTTLTLTLILNKAGEEKIALYWAQQLKRLGIELSIRTLDTAQFTGALNDYDYDLISHRWINTLSPGTEQTIYWSCQAGKAPGGRNYAGICEDEIDSLAAQLATATTQDELSERAQALDRAIMATNLMIPLGGMDKDYFAVQDGLSMPDVTPLYGPVTETWWRN